MNLENTSASDLNSHTPYYRLSDKILHDEDWEKIEDDFDKNEKTMYDILYGDEGKINNSKYILKEQNNEKWIEMAPNQSLNDYDMLSDVDVPKKENKNNQKTSNETLDPKVITYLNYQNNIIKDQSDQMLSLVDLLDNSNKNMKILQNKIENENNCEIKLKECNKYKNIFNLKNFVLLLLLIILICLFFYKKKYLKKFELINIYK